MIRFSQHKTLTQAYAHLFWGMLSEDDWIDGFLDGPNRRWWSRDHIVQITHPVSEVNIMSVGFRKGRWTKFLTEYFDQKAFHNFLVFLAERRLNDSVEYAFQCSTNARHSLGNCIFGISVRTGHNPRVTLISRSCNIAPTGVLDVSM